MTHKLLTTGILIGTLWSPAAVSQENRPLSPLETQKLQMEVQKLQAELAEMKSQTNQPRAELEKEKLQGEINKLRTENEALRNTTFGAGQWLPWLQAAGIGSLIGGLLVLLAGRSLSSVQASKVRQDLQFAADEHELQSKKLAQEMGIARSQHDLKLFEGLGAAEPRIRVGAISELGQRIRELNESLETDRLTPVEQRICERERQTIIRVLIAITKYEGEEAVQKHIADLIAEVVNAVSTAHAESPLAPYDFQGAQLTNAWWKGVDARKVDFYGACLARAGLAESQLGRTILKGANLREATLRKAAGEEANLERADLTGAHAEGSVFRKASFRRATLAGADFRSADLEGADLTGAVVTGANFQRCRLQSAKLQGVDLRTANLQEADLTGIETDAETKLPHEEPHN